MVKVSRWLTLAVGCLITVSTGLNYSFSLVGPVAKDWFGLDEHQITLLPACINLGSYLAIFSGRLYAVLQDRHNLGPRLVMWVGSVMMCIGYGGLYLQAAGYITPTLARLLICCVIAGNASTYWDTSVIVTNVVNFPDDRGSVIGVLKAFHGMSASVYATAFWVLFASIEWPSPPEPAEGGGQTLTLLHSWSHTSWTQILLNPMATLTSLTQPLASQPQSQTTHLNLNSADSSGRGDLPPALRWFLFLAIVPSSLNLIGSLFINVVPKEYHETITGSSVEEEEVAEEGGAPALTSTTGQAVVARPVNKQARLVGLYCVVACMAVLQGAGALIGDVHIEKIEMWVILGLLSLILLVPISTGPLIQRSIRDGHHRQSRTVRTPSATPDAGQDDNDDNDEDEESSRILALPLLPDIDERADSHVASDIHSRRGQDQNPRAAVQPAAVTKGTPSQKKQDPEEGQQQQEQEQVAYRVPPYRQLHHTVLLNGLHRAQSLRETSVGAALKRVSFWALMASFLSASATGLTYLNNLGAITTALGGPKGGHVPFVSLFSVANACGRLLFGHASEAFMHPSSPMPLPRTVFLALAAGLSTITTALLAAGPSLHTLYLLSLLAGLSFGGHWSLLPAIATDLYGLRSFSTLYAVLQLAPAVSAFAFASGLAGYVSSHASAEQGGDECLGLPCFQPTFQALLPLSGVTLGVVAWLVMAKWNLYRRRWLSGP